MIIKFEISKDNVLQYLGDPPTSVDEAFEITFCKWMTLREHPHVVDGGEHTCGLCMWFYKDYSCSECLVFKQTFLQNCYFTPYTKFYNAQCTWKSETELVAIIDAKLDFLHTLKDLPI
jgi:hypothetical protein